MIIIWRGWGILVLLFGAVGTGAAGVLSHGNTVATGVGLAAAGAGIWFLGRWLNELAPKAAFAAAMEFRAQELRRIVDVGAYCFPGLPAPQSYDEALAQSEEQLALESAQARPAYFNKHTFFFVPMQYLGLVLGAGALMVVISGLIIR
ncbi:hypothetical protein [Arthrobacter celericrescens]|uniref:hypothetical protein n=1 Tax=Arthrobacter celericrescens TaxID=2320851 RepID=UPI000EA0C88F|nr:hypothetical protein [Arthrobacter celericrescens]